MFRHKARQTTSSMSSIEEQEDQGDILDRRIQELKSKIENYLKDHFGFKKHEKDLGIDGEISFGFDDRMIKVLTTITTPAVKNEQVKLTKDDATKYVVIDLKESGRNRYTTIRGKRPENDANNEKLQQLSLLQGIQDALEFALKKRYGHFMEARLNKAGVGKVVQADTMHATVTVKRDESGRTVGDLTAVECPRVTAVSRTEEEHHMVNYC